MEEKRLHRPIAITLDGPVASGKTAVGKLVAERLDCRFLDTGMMYRAVTYAAQQREVSLEDLDGLVELAERLDMSLSAANGKDRLTMDGEDVTGKLRLPVVERGVSLVARVPGVRRAMVSQQRAIAGQGPIVMVGRDIGTVVLPDAPTKVFLTASVGERARRRHMEMERQGAKGAYEQVLAELQRRDKIDSERDDSPLRPAKDAAVLNTDGKTIQELVEQIVSFIGRD
jgi:cytidylate kinase